MSGASFAEEHIIDTDDNKDDPYDLSLTLEDTEDDFNIEDITEDQVKELLADEENRFLLDHEEPTESTSSQINIIERRSNNSDKISVKGKSSDSKSFRNTGNLITIDCDDEDEEEESELDDRRHSKFKSERVIRSVDKKQDEKDIPESLEAVVLYSKESQNSSNGQSFRGNNPNQRGKSRNFMAPHARPFIGNNSLSSIDILPTPLQSFNRIHVNPNFKHLTAAQGPRLGNPLESNNFRHVRPRGGLHQPRLMGLPRQMGSRPVSSFEELGGTFPINPIIGADSIEAIMASQSLEYEMEEHPSSHRFIPNNNRNTPRPPLFSEPFVDNWSPNQGVISNHQPWMKHPNRPSIGNYQRIPGVFHGDPNLRAPLLGPFQRGIPMNNSLFGNPPRHPQIHNRLPHLAFFNQPGFAPLMHPHSLEVARGRPQRLESTPHPVPGNIQRHEIPMRLGYSFVNQGQKRPQPSMNSPRLPAHHDSKRANNINPIASTSAIKQNLGHPVKNNIHLYRAQDPSSAPQSINKVTSSLGQRTHRPSTSNVNLKNIRPIKTVNSITSSITAATSLEARKAALLKKKAAQRLIQKENMNRAATSSIKQVELISSSTLPDASKEEPNTQNKDVQQPMAVDLNIDDEYKKKLEEQKRLREEIIRKKEERRKQMVVEKMKQTTNPSTTISSTTSPIPTTSSFNVVPSATSTLKTGQQLRRAAINSVDRPTTSTDSQANSEKRFPIIPLKRKPAESDCNPPSSLSEDVKKVKIKGLAQMTSKATITKLCTSVGPIEDCVVDVTNAEKKAIVTFKSSQHARQFQSRYQRHLVDLCVIQVSLL